MGNEGVFTLPCHPDRRPYVDNLLAERCALSSETYGICPVTPVSSGEVDSQNMGPTPSWVQWSLHGQV